MSLEKFIRLFKDNFNDFFNNLWIIIIGLGFWVFVNLISFIGGRIGYLLQTTISNIIWVAVSFAVLLAGGGFVLSGLIGVCLGIVERKKHSFIFNGKKFWKKNFLILLIFSLSSILIGRAAHYGASAIGGIFGLNIKVAQLIFILIYFIGLIGFMIFISFSSFFIVINNLSVIESISKSFWFVKKKYLASLSLMILFFITYFFLGKVEGLVEEVLEYLVLLPFSVLVMTRFALDKEESQKTV